MGGGDLSMLLADIAILHGCAPESLQEIALDCHLTQIQKGGLLYDAGEKPRAFHQILSGGIKIAIGSPQGGEKVIEVVTAGGHCGLSELFADGAHLCYAEAIEASLVLCVKKDVLLRAAQRDAQLALQLLAAVARRQCAIERDIADSHLLPGGRRLTDYLLRLPGTVNALGERLVELPIPKSLLAALLGLTPETLSRTLRELSTGGLIRVNGRQVSLLPKLVGRLPADRADAKRSIRLPAQDGGRNEPPQTPRRARGGARSTA
ncbi:MAG: Crp/Fnr family transcriptional regulator [Rhodocyclaceae bacterium]|nr:Crp/Fnr family transcriptional regulator [Rhodocyclaceae bacterium]